MTQIERPAPVRFRADRMLGKLARYLRMLGHDVAWTRDASRQEVVEATGREGRTLLTRDRALARAIPGAFFVEQAYPFHQTRQVLRAFHLDDAAAFSRCIEDNEVLVPVSVEEVAAEVPPRVSAVTSRFLRCRACWRVYWPGSHVERMRGTLMALLDAPVPADAHATPEPEGAALGRLEPLLDLHQALDALFWAHRLAVVRGDLDEGLRQLRRFAMNMARHVHLEDELVLPVYAMAEPSEGFPRGGAPDIFRRDHALILSGLERLVQLAEAMPSTSGEARDLARIELLDEERRYVDLLAHHDHRERAFLYPRLSEALSADEQVDLLDRLLVLG